MPLPDLFEHSAPPPRRRNPLHLPVDPTDEDLARHWTLSAPERAEILRCRGDANRLRFALQLCVLRQCGRFLIDYDAVPVRIVNHVGRQLGLAPVLFVGAPDRDATDYEHEHRIREYLGFERFTPEIQTRLEHWLVDHGAAGTRAAELLPVTEALLLTWKVVLPARSSLERLIASVSVRAQDGFLHRITERLDPALCRLIDELLAVSEEDRRSMLFQLKGYPPEPTPTAIQTYLERFHLLESLGIDQIDLSDLSSRLTQDLAQLVRQYDASDLKRFPPVKRYAIIACFLRETQKNLLDYLVAMHDQFLTGLSRRARHAFERRYREGRRQARIGLERMLAAMELVLDPRQQPETVLEALYQAFSPADLRQAVESCRTFQTLETRGYLNELQARYSHLKRYWPAFLSLPFQAEPGMEPLCLAIDVARQLHAGTMKALPPDTPIQFVPTRWRTTLIQDDGTIDHRVWEMALALAVRDALRAGDLYLPESRHHVSFWNLVYNTGQWAKEREHAYQRLHLQGDPDRALACLHDQFDSIAHVTQQGLRDNPFAIIHDGKLKLKRQDALEVPDQVHQLRRVIETHLPRVRIEELLLEVDSWCHFTEVFRPLGGYTPRSENVYTPLLAALVAHGTNLGIATMGQSTEGVTVDMLQHISRWFLNTETLKAANTVLVDYHHSLDLSAVWGEGTTSSSDGQRFGIEASSLLASFYPRYFGYYDRAVTVYTHVSDQYSVFASQAISCSPREAIYVLDGLLENDTILNPREHYTDSHGYTEQLFGLCYLLGYAFMPRLKDLADQQLYTVNGHAIYGLVDSLFRASVDTHLIQQQWDQLVRVAASLQNRTAPAHVVLQRLAGSSPSDQLAKALTALGRVVKTIYILQYIHDPAVRQRVQLQLNRGEFRHKLAKRLFFANQGIFRTGDYEEIMNKVSALSLLSNAVLVWNTVKIGTIVETLRTQGESVAPEDLARVSPLMAGHIIPNGTYHFNRAVQERLA